MSKKANSTENSTQEAVYRYLQRNPLKNVLHLKMLSHFGHLAQSFHIADDSDEGVLLLFPSTASSHDHQDYPDCDLVILPVADSPHLLIKLLDHIPHLPLVFKLIRGEDETVVQQFFKGARRRMLANYTLTGPSQFNLDPRVAIHTQLNSALIEGFAHNGYTTSELAHFFKVGGKALSIQENGRTVSVGMVYPNFAHIWEIAGLFTQPVARRKGYSNSIVQAALHILEKNGYTPRFVANETNKPSLNLAESVGLERFLNVYHYVAS